MAIQRASRWVACAALVIWLGAVSQAVGAQAPVPVTLGEQADWVLSDTYYPGPVPQPDPGFAWPAWPVVRLDVTNNDVALGVFSVFIGARPGTYDWSGRSNAAMQFGSPWLPANADPSNPPYLPQKDNDNGTLDWSTELLPVMHTAAGDVVDVGDMALGVAVALKLPDSFAGYDAVYHLATMGPFFACGGGCPLDSVPIPQGQTFSFYVTGGLASPMVYFDQADFRADGSLNLTFNGGSIPAAIPEPGAALLLGVGWATIALLHRRRRV